MLTIVSYMKDVSSVFHGTYYTESFKNRLNNITFRLFLSNFGRISILTYSFGKVPYVYIEGHFF